MARKTIVIDDEDQDGENRWQQINETLNRIEVRLNLLENGEEETPNEMTSEMEMEELTEATEDLTNATEQLTEVVEELSETEEELTEEVENPETKTEIEIEAIPNDLPEKPKPSIWRTLLFGNDSGESLDV